MKACFLIEVLALHAQVLGQRLGAEAVGAGGVVRGIVLPDDVAPGGVLGLPGQGALGIGHFLGRAVDLVVEVEHLPRSGGDVFGGVLVHGVDASQGLIATGLVEVGQGAVVPLFLQKPHACNFPHSHHPKPAD